MKIAWYFSSKIIQKFNLNKNYKNIRHTNLWKMLCCFSEKQKKMQRKLKKLYKDEENKLKSNKKEQQQLIDRKFVKTIFLIGLKI